MYALTQIDAASTITQSLGTASPILSVSSSVTGSTGAVLSADTTTGAGSLLTLVSGVTTVFQVPELPEWAGVCFACDRLYTATHGHLSVLSAL
jgi:hypothetical protein